MPKTKRKDKIDAIAKLLGVIAIVSGGLFGAIKYYDYHREKRLERISHTIEFIEKYNSEPFVSYREHLNYVIFYGCVKSDNPTLLIRLEEIAFVPDRNDPDQGTRRLKVVLTTDDKKYITQRIHQCAAKEAFAVIELIDLLYACVDSGLCDKHMFIRELRSRSNTLAYFLDDFIEQTRSSEHMDSFGAGVYAARERGFSEVILDQRVNVLHLQMLRKTTPR